MLLRGTGFIETNAGAGIGWACCDYERQDLTRPIVAYIWITPDSVEGATPPAPYFQSVSPGSGGIDVELRCSEAVDGFELSHSTIALPDLNLIQYSQSGVFHVTTEVQQYLFGRTVRTGKRSDWTPYGTSPPGYSPWETVWNDSFSHYTGDTAYPGLSHVWGTGGDYVYVRFASPNRVCCHNYYNPQSLSIFGTATGVKGSYCGARHQFKAYFNWYGTSDEKAEELGVVFGARVEILTSYLTETYYVLAGRRKNATELYFRLYSVTGSTFTQLDISGNVHSYFPLLTTPYEIQFTRIGDDFYVHKISTGEEVWHTTDDSIPPASNRIYTGVWMTGPIPLGSGGTPYIWDYWKIYRMVIGQDPAVVDPGHPYDGLQAAELTSAFGAGYRFLIEANNDVEDFCHYRVGDSAARQPKVATYRWDAEAEDYVAEDERDLRLSTDIVAAAYGGTGADLSGGGAVGDLIIADDATTFKRLAGNITATQKFLSQTGDGAASADPTWETVDLSSYVTTAGLTAGTVPKASDTHALADSILTEAAGVVSAEGDLTLNADGVGENRTLTIEGWDTGASAVRSHTISTNTAGDFVYTAANDERHLFKSGSTDLFQVGLTTAFGNTNKIYSAYSGTAARSVDSPMVAFDYIHAYNASASYHYAPTLLVRAIFQNSVGSPADTMLGAIEARSFVGNSMVMSADAGMMNFKSTITTRNDTTVNKGYHYYAGYWNFATYGTLVNEYGFYCNTLVGTNKYAFYSVNGDVIFNDSGSAAIVRMEGDTDQNLFYLKGSTDQIGIGTNAPAAKLDVAGTVKLGAADTDAITCTGRLIIRTVNDAGMAATNGTVGEIVFNSDDTKFYGCTVTGTPATWAALN